jgi:hypothetical protein
LLNFLAAAFVGLSAISAGWMVDIAVDPYGRFNPFPPPAPVIPFEEQATATLSPTGTAEPTLQPGTPTPSALEGSATSTELPAPSPTLFKRQTEATRQATPTVAPSVSPTPSPSVTPKPSPTRSVFTYTASVDYQVHPVQLCDWMGVAGAVTDLEGRPSLGAFVHVWGLGNVDQVVAVGEYPSYGASGWEVRLARAQIIGNWSVQLVASPETKRPLSEVYTISMPGDCKKNLAWIRFQQNH